jgi:membrane-associated phospholipid phosphatase
MQPSPAHHTVRAVGTSIDRPPARTLDLLDAPPGGPSDRIGWMARRHSPVWVAVVITLLGAVAMGALLVGLGLLLTHALLPRGLGAWDEHVNEWFLRRRTATMTGLTALGTTIGSTLSVVAVAAVAVIVLSFRRLWREAGLITIALTVEFLVFLSTTLIVNRPRPSVPRLDPSPPTSSFPSGHEAAAIALWMSLAIVITTHVHNAMARTVVWSVALGLPVFVGISRVYRGMHHPTDVLASIVLGAGAIVTAMIAVRSASAVTERRERQVLKDPIAGSPAARVST